MAILKGDIVGTVHQLDTKTKIGGDIALGANGQILEGDEVRAVQFQNSALVGIGGFERQ